MGTDVKKNKNEEEKIIVPSAKKKWAEWKIKTMGEVKKQKKNDSTFIRGCL